MEGVYSEAEEDLADPVDVLVVDEPVEFVFVLEEHDLGGFLSLGLSLVLHHFVVFGQLYFVGFDHFRYFCLV